MANPMKARLRAGKACVGVLITMPSPALAQVLASCGYDYLFIDMEHGAIDLASCQQMIQATAGTECAPLVRVGKPDKALCKPVLDAGAMGMIFPMINDRALAEATVEAMFYPPKGQRGWGPFLAPIRWGQPDAMAYFKIANEELVNTVLIEHIDAVEALDEILAVPGLDVANVAPMDLAVSMGHPGDRDHPEVKAAIARAEKKILESKVALGGMALSPEEANEKIDRGYRFLVLGYDVMLIQRVSAQLLDGIRR